MNKAIIYKRISTRLSRQDIERQQAPIENFCKNKGFEIIGQYGDDVSGTVPVDKRLGYSDMLSFIQGYEDKSELNIVFDEVSRLGRKKKVIFDALDFFIQHKINVHFVSPSATLLNEDGSINESADMVITIFSQLAESERNRIVDRVNTSLPRTLEKGKTLGGVQLYGYTVDEEKNVVLDPEQAEIIREIFDLYLKGNGSKTIANTLNLKDDCPSPTGTKWTARTINNFIKNRTYIGERTVKGVGTYTIDSIIDDEIFNKATEIREGKYNTKHRKRDIPNPFTSILKCGCGSPIYVGVDRGHYIYRCSSRMRSKGTCDSFQSFNFNKLNNSVYTFFDVIVRNTDLYSGQIREEVIKELGNIDTVYIPLVKDRLSKVDRKVKQVWGDYDELEIDKTERNMKLNKIDKEASELNEELLRLQIRSKEIIKQIDLIDSEKDKETIVDIESFRLFVQKYINNIEINRIERPPINDLDTFNTFKGEYFFNIKIDTEFGTSIDYIIGNRGNYLFWKFYQDGHKIENSEKVAEGLEDDKEIRVVEDSDKSLYVATEIDKKFFYKK